MITKKLVGRKGTSANYLIFNSSGTKKTGTINWDISKREWLTLENIAVFTIAPKPSDAIVTITASGYTQDGNRILVKPGTVVNYTITKDGYEPKSGQVTVQQNTTIDGTLDPLITITIDPIPSNASVTLKYVG